MNNMILSLAIVGLFSACGNVSTASSDCTASLVQGRFLSSTTSSSTGSTSCDDTDENETTDAEFDSLTIVDNGAVIPEPIRTRVVISGYGNVSYYEEQLDSDGNVTDTLDFWDADLSAEDMTTLQDLIAAADLENQSDVTLSDEENACDGGASLDISFNPTDGASNAFTIPGTVRCRASEMPDDLEELLDFVDEIQANYEN